MLAPRNRSLLLEALRPPIGYRLDQAIATTYTLDLIALLTAPLAFTFFDWEDDEGRPSADPLALLEAVRRHARKLHVFCQGGAIHVPKGGQVLLAHLEQCVVEVAAPRGGVFHPKVWVLRYEPQQDEEESVRYRLLVGSRNLTFDRSWDTMLRLDGELLDRKNGISSNRPLTEFVAALPSMAIHGAPVASERSAKKLASELRKVEWELPPLADECEFLPLGLGRQVWPFGIGRGHLVMAPFADAWFLNQVNSDREGGIVISRSDTLQEANAALERFSECFVLSSGVDDEYGVDEGAEGGGPQETLLNGLHAKLFVFDDGWNSHLFTGSANATRAAMERNVEFLVRLKGKKSRLGIEALLGRDGPGGLFELLDEWTPIQPEDDEERELRRKLEKAAEGARNALANARLQLEVTPGTEKPGEFTLHLQGKLPKFQDDLQLKCWPVVLPEGSAVTPKPGNPIASFPVSLGAATAFLAFEVIVNGGGLQHKVRFARRLPLIGVPDNRDERLLRSLLKDRETVMRLLYLLLCAEEVSAADLTALARGEGGGSWGTGGHGFPLFEAMVHALARGPEALSPVERLVTDLCSTEEGRALLPDGFEELWATVAESRDELAK